MLPDLTGIIESLAGSALLHVIVEMHRYRRTGRRIDSKRVLTLPSSADDQLFDQTHDGTAVDGTGKLLARLILTPMLAVFFGSITYGLFIGLGALPAVDDAMTQPSYLLWMLLSTIGAWFVVTRFGPLKVARIR